MKTLLLLSALLLAPIAHAYECDSYDDSYETQDSYNSHQAPKENWIGPEASERGPFHARRAPRYPENLIGPEGYEPPPSSYSLDSSSSDDYSSCQIDH